MLLTRQDGQAAVLALVAALLGFLALGLVFDIGLMAVQRTRLDHAAEAAARAAARACQDVTVAAAGANCPLETAEQYLHANLPAAQVDAVQLAPSGVVTVGASLLVEHPFAALWNAPPARLVAQSSAKIP